MKVIVIGATGFVGKAIVSELRGNLISVIAVGGPRSAPLQEADGLQSINGIDITNSDDMATLENIQNVDAVIHAAGLAHQFGKVTREDLWNVNVAGTEKVARLAQNLAVRHFMLISSVLVYGRGSSRNEVLSEISICQPEDAYARSKLAGEEIASEICGKAAIPLTILRPAPIIGEGSKGNFRRLIRLIAKRRFVWLGNGRNRKSLVSVSDVAKACRVVLENKKSESEIFNIAGPPMEMKEIVTEITRSLSLKPSNISIPVTPVRGILKFGTLIFPVNGATRLLNTIEKWISDDIYSAEKIRQQYGFAADSDLKAVIRLEVDWYIKQT